MALDDLAQVERSLLGGLDRFVQGQQQLQLRQSLDAAATEMEDLTEQFTTGRLEEKKFRQKSRENANQLQLQLLQIGAPASQIQQAFKALAPQQFGSIEQAELGELGREEAAGLRTGREISREQRRFEQEKELLGIKGEQKAKALKAKGKKALTETQAKARLFGARMKQADTALQKLTDQGFDPTSVSTGIQDVLPNRLQSAKVQLYNNSLRNFTQAVTRKESGAAITDAELEQARLIYWPIPGDSAEVLAQKAENRRVATQLLMEEGQIDPNSPLFIKSEEVSPTQGLKKKTKGVTNIPNIPGLRRR